jgi:hypothetical protein
MAKRSGKSPAEIDLDEFTRTLAERRIMISLFNDIEGQEKTGWYPAVQYLGTKGYFGAYDARPGEHVSSALAEAWVETSKRLVQREGFDAIAEARKNWKAEQQSGSPVIGATFAEMLDRALMPLKARRSTASQVLQDLRIEANAQISRADGCILIYRATAPR